MPLVLGGLVAFKNLAKFVFLIVLKEKKFVWDTLSNFAKYNTASRSLSILDKNSQIKSVASLLVVEQFVKQC
jgi:hypothetical protein